MTRRVSSAEAPAVATAGRPTKYLDKVTVAKVTELEQLENGATVTAIAHHLGVDVSTVSDWQAIYPDFSRAVNSCRTRLTRRLEGAMLGQAEGSVVGSAVAGIFLLKNIAPQEYRDKREHHIEVTQTVEIDYQGFEEDYIEGTYENIDES
jgi:transposase-like protein